MNIERVHAWINEGAQLSIPSAACCAGRLRSLSLKPKAPQKGAKRRAASKSRAKKDGSKFVPASRRAVNKHKKA